MEPDVKTNDFYVVSKLKFSVLFLATVGLYLIYWFYINWRNYRDATGANVIPPLRSVFYIFFTHSLFNKIDSVLKNNKIEYSWSPRILATLFVVLSIVSNLLDRLSFKEIGSPLTDILSLVMLPFMLLIILKAQDAINFSQNDREGSSNSHFTLYNSLWVVLGVLFWVLMGAGLFYMNS